MSEFDEHNDDLDDLFKDQFENFEADVNSSAWDNINKKIHPEEQAGYLALKFKDFYKEPECRS